MHDGAKMTFLKVCPPNIPHSETNAIDPVQLVLTSSSSPPTPRLLNTTHLTGKITKINDCDYAQRPQSKHNPHKNRNRRRNERIQLRVTFRSKWVIRNRNLAALCRQEEVQEDMTLSIQFWHTGKECADL